MPRYSPAIQIQPTTLEELIEHVKRETLAISDSLVQPAPYGIQMEVLHASPKGPTIGLVAFADGTSWNPGSGEGLYVYKTAGWTLCG